MTPAASILSISKCLENLNRIERTINQTSAKAVEAGAHVIFAESQARVPVRTGALYASGKVTMQSSENQVSAIISYGSPDVINPVSHEPTSEYAERKHEDPRNGKWLENAMINKANQALDVMAYTLHGVIG